MAGVVVREAVAMVIARTPALARDAAELVQVDWAPLAAVATIADALAEGAPQLWPGASKNLCFSETYGDSAKTEAAIAGAAHVVRHSFLNQRIVNAQMEPRSAIGDFDPASGLCTLITGSQGVHRLHMGLAGPLQLPAEQLRVLTYDTGGGFGPRNDPYIEYLLLVWAARRLGRAVKWTALHLGSVEPRFPEGGARASFARSFRLFVDRLHASATVAACDARVRKAALPGHCRCAPRVRTGREQRRAGRRGGGGGGGWAQLS